MSGATGSTFLGQRAALIGHDAAQALLDFARAGTGRRLRDDAAARARRPPRTAPADGSTIPGGGGGATGSTEAWPGT